jgi:SAM-dependent methyltransferase
LFFYISSKGWIPLEQSGKNTYIFDPESSTELGRLMNQDRQLTKGMGGVFTGLSAEEIATFNNVLDLGCGPGGWALDVAFAYPHIEAAGIDISRAMIDYANTRAQVQKLPNASFEVMDITKPLEFADGAFDLINARYLFAVLKRDSWTSFLKEALRLLRPGGILRLTEPADLSVSSSPAIARLNALVSQMLWRSGYGFSPDGTTMPAVAYRLPSLLRAAGLQEVRTQAYAIESSAGTPTWADTYHNAEVGWSQLIPLLVRARIASQEELEPLYQQMLIEFQQPDFALMWQVVTVLGKKPL